MTTSARSLSVLYRGPLSSCNYDCAYCPFAKHVSSRDELSRDEAGLARFVEWVEHEADRDVGVLFTPWGEALIRSWYRDAMLRLSWSERVTRVAAQTNLTGPQAWLSELNRDTAALWVTYHPTQIAYEKLLARVLHLSELGLRHSVGVVGLRENLPLAQRLRTDLPDDVYLWVNAYKSEGPAYYEAGEAEAFARIDPLFALNNVRHPSAGEGCRAGADAITVDGEGNVRRCHFVDDALGNLYRTPLAELLSERACPNATCGCYIGYVHLDRLGLYDVYGDGVLERVPARAPSRLRVVS